MEGIAPLGTIDPQHAIAQLVKALAYPARAFASVQPRNGNSPIHLEGSRCNTRRPTTNAECGPAQVGGSYRKPRNERMNKTTTIKPTK